LFIFEFFVVTLGVMAALALVDWHGHRSALVEMEETKAEADRQVAFHYAVAIGWKQAAQCIDERMTVLMKELGSDGPVDPKLLARPTMEGGNLPLPSDEQRVLLTERYGADRSQDYWAASQSVAKLGNHVTDIVNDWAGFAMIDPANGAVDDRDRHEARVAASRVKAALHGIEITADNIIGRARALGVAADSQGEFRLIRNCDDLWQTGMTHPNKE
jgi:hypothetical protein